ncbi:hypothetical protein [Effusibacillus dendaii]|uniref:Uncharacterized protein n=1 Tax=Effusibacillus dendaii TaxID=2743772 RepID=A0A7I8DHD4_9BACL|nr:hypothetical protein [Effusibacillus dendaii]BCJ88030.1 hypothetical protein skT53_30150 [Effusibacillus dendaii]
MNPCSGSYNECILVQSVICSRAVFLTAEAKIPACHLQLKLDPSGEIKQAIRLIAGESSDISINLSLVKDIAVVSGFIRGIVVINNRISCPVVLPFQTEFECKGICPEDNIRNTIPVVQGILPPLGIPHGDDQQDAIVFKVILKTQVTVTRERIAKANLEILGDVNEDRCKQPAQVVTIPRFETKNEEEDEDDENDGSKF